MGAHARKERRRNENRELERQGFDVPACVLLSAVVRRCSGGGQRPVAAEADPRVGLKPGLRDAGEAARNMERIAACRSPKASSIRRRRPATRVRPRPRMPRRAAVETPPRAAPFDPIASNRLELHQLRPGVQRQPRLRRQLSRLQHLRHRARRAGRSCSRRSCAPAGRATCRCTATCCSCRWSRRAAASTAARRVCRRRSAPSGSAASASSTSPT